MTVPFHFLLTRLNFACSNFLPLVSLQYPFHASHSRVLSSLQWPYLFSLASFSSSAAAVAFTSAIQCLFLPSLSTFALQTRLLACLFSPPSIGISNRPYVPVHNISIIFLPSHSRHPPFPSPFPCCQLHLLRPSTCIPFPHSSIPLRIKTN